VAARQAFEAKLGSRYLEEIGDELPYDFFAQQAHIAADIDTIRILRNRLTGH